MRCALYLPKLVIHMTGFRVCIFNPKIQSNFLKAIVPKIFVFSIVLCKFWVSLQSSKMCIRDSLTPHQAHYCSLGIFLVAATTTGVVRMWDKILKFTSQSLVTLHFHNMWVKTVTKSVLSSCKICKSCSYLVSVNIVELCWWSNDFIWTTSAGLGRWLPTVDLEKNFSNVPWIMQHLK